MFDVYSTYRELVTVPPELDISQNDFDRLNDMTNDMIDDMDNDFERDVNRDDIIDQFENDDAYIKSITDADLIQSKNEALMQSIESNLLGLLKTYAFGVVTMVSSYQNTQVQNIQYFGFGNPNPDWLAMYMRDLRHSLLNMRDADLMSSHISQTQYDATIVIRQINIFDFLKTKNNELIKLLSPAMTSQSLKDYSVAKTILDHWTQYFDSKVFLSEANRYELVSSAPEYIQILSEAESKRYIHGVDLSNRIIIDAKKGTLI